MGLGKDLGSPGGAISLDSIFFSDFADVYHLEGNSAGMFNVLNKQIYK
jgi:hypothetical protein